MSDGYHSHSGFNRLEKFKSCSNLQIKINSRMKDISRELERLPKPPKSMDTWIDSWTDPLVSGFTLNNFTKSSKMKKEYYDLLESADINLQEMKILAIEDLLDKIKNIVD